MAQLDQIIFNLKMKRAALRQMLRDMADDMEEEAINEILDQIIEIEELLVILEQAKKS